MPNKPSKRPTKKQLLKVYPLYKEGKPKYVIARELGIGKETYRKYKWEIEGFLREKSKIDEREQKKREKKKRREQAHTGKDKGGRPPGITLTPEKRKQAVLFAEAGCSNEKIAELLGVCQATLYNWFNADPSFKYEVNVAAEKVDYEIVNMVIKRSRGMTLTDVTVNERRDAKGTVLERYRTVHRRRILPSIPAMKYILANRKGWSIGGASGDFDGETTEFDIREKLYNQEDIDNEQSSEQ